MRPIWSRVATAGAAFGLLVSVSAGSIPTIAQAARRQAPASFKVGLVTDTGGLNDHGFNHLSDVGLLRAERLLHITGHVVQSQQQADYVPNLTHFAQAGYNVVIAVGFLMDGAVKQVAKQFPHTRFIIIDDPITGDANVASAIFQTQECGYLVGVMSALAYKDHALPHLGNTNTFGAVGGMTIPPVTTYIAGYIQGIKKYDPTAKILVTYTSNFNDAASGAEAAQTLHGEGANLIFQVAGGSGLGVITAARQHGYYAIGVDANQNYLAPSVVITSALKKVDVATFDLVASAFRNHWKSGVQYFDLKNNGVGYAAPISAIPASIVRQVAKVRLEIINGKIHVSPTIPAHF